MISLVVMLLEKMTCCKFWYVWILLSNGFKTVGLISGCFIGPFGMCHEWVSFKLVLIKEVELHVTQFLPGAHFDSSIIKLILD